MEHAQIELKQTKRYIGPTRFGVFHEVVLAQPELLTNLFVIDLSHAPQDKERFVRVATLEDLVGTGPSGELPIRPLTVFADTQIDFSDVLNGDRLVFTEVPPEWGEPLPTFTVAAALGTSLRVTAPFLWSVTMPTDGAEGLGWELYRGMAKLKAGSHGWTSRVGGDGLVLTDRFFNVLTDGTAALNHIASVQTYVKSLAANAGLDGSEYEKYAPGNPLTNTYPETT